MLYKDKETYGTGAIAMDEVMRALPGRIKREILAIGSHRRDFPHGLSEIGIRLYSRSGITVSGENIPLFSRVTREEILSLYDRLLGCSFHTHESEIREGFVTAENGVRVGISSFAVGGDMPSEIYGLSIRIPTALSETADTIFDAFLRYRRGILIYSLPSGGKTSALKSLAGMIAERLAMRVCVIDERREFIPRDYSKTTVDILSGYKKARGIEIALRTLSPEVMIIDEIGSLGECEAIRAVGRGGVPIIATAHADSREELMTRSAIRPLLRDGYFPICAHLFKEGAKHLCEIEVGDKCFISV